MDMCFKDGSDTMSVGSLFQIEMVWGTLQMNKNTNWFWQRIETSITIGSHGLHKVQLR